VVNATEEEKLEESENVVENVVKKRVENESINLKEKIRAEKTKRYKELKKHKGGKEWEYYFLNYKPGEKDVKKEDKKKTRKSKRGKSKRKTMKRGRKRRKKRGFFNF